jgi:hypothetical protein
MKRAYALDRTHRTPEVQADHLVSLGDRLGLQRQHIAQRQRAWFARRQSARRQTMDAPTPPDLDALVTLSFDFATRSNDPQRSTPSMPA